MKRWTAKERRMRSRSDEEVIDELDLRLPYRMGWLRSLPVLPVQQTPVVDVSTYVQDHASVYRRIQTNICDAERVKYRFGSPRLVFRYSYDDEIPSAEDVTLLLDCEVSEISWINAVKEIRKCLCHKGLHFRIEFFDSSAARRINHVIYPDDAVVSQWKSQYQTLVLSKIEDKKWQTVNVFRRGSSTERSKCPVTLLISALDANDDSWWDRTLPGIRILWPYKVELYQATNILCLDRMGLTIGMGSSVGQITMSSQIIEKQAMETPYRHLVALCRGKKSRSSRRVTQILSPRHGN
ncbi:hypothetical protein V8E54_007065 [Elaphomyces granulatus]